MGYGRPHERGTPSLTPRWASLGFNGVQLSTRSTRGDGGKEELVIGVYVDDLIITGARAGDINSFKREMMAHF